MSERPDVLIEFDRPYPFHGTVMQPGQRKLMPISSARRVTAHNPPYGHALPAEEFEEHTPEAPSYEEPQFTEAASHSLDDHGYELSDYDGDATGKDNTVVKGDVLVWLRAQEATPEEA